MEKMPDNPVAVLKGTSALDLDPVRLVQQMYAALNRGDSADVLALLAEDVFWEVPGPRDILPWSGGWRGHSGVADFLAMFEKTVKSNGFTPQRLITQGNTVVAVIEDQSICKATGLPYEGSVVHLITVQDGKIASVQYYMDTFPIVEAFLGGRPFTVKPAVDNPYYVVVPVAAPSDTTAAVFKVVRQMYAALQAADLARMRDLLADDILWHMFGPPDILSWAGQRHGPDSALESASQILQTLKIEYSRPVRFISQENSVVVVIEEGGTSAATGLPFKTSVVHLITVNDAGKVQEVLNYINTIWLVDAFLGGRPFIVT